MNQPISWFVEKFRSIRDAVRTFDRSLGKKTQVVFRHGMLWVGLMMGVSATIIFQMAIIWQLLEPRLVLVTVGILLLLVGCEMVDLADDLIRRARVSPGRVK